MKSRLVRHIGAQMKPVKIGCWMFFFSALAFAVLNSTCLDAKWYASPTASRQINKLQTFTRRLTSVNAKKSIILGPCYAAWLKDRAGFLNLGLQGISPSEVQEVAEQHIPRNAKIYYVVSIRDVYRANESPRHGIASDLGRWQRVLNAKLMKCEADEQSAPNRSKYTRILNQITMAEKINATDLSFCHRFEELFPNTTFVLFPTYPLPSSEFGKKDAAFRRAFANSGLCFIDLGGLVEPKDFIDFYHVKPSAYNRNLLWSALQKHQASSKNLPPSQQLSAS